MADHTLATNRDKTPLLQKLSCATGHILNELFLQMAISFNLLYFIKVAKLDGDQAGWILLITLVLNAVSAPIAGYCGDVYKIPLLARVLGRRKAWHLIGVIVMATFFPLLHTRCLLCTDDSSWQKFAYYLTFMVCLNGFGLPLLDVGHLSIIAVVAKDQKESIELNVLRTMFTYASGILAYGVTWIILGNESGDQLSPSSWKDFTTANCILVGIGLIFSVIFHIGTKEPKIKTEKAVDEFFTKQGLLIVAMAFLLGSGAEEDDTGTDGNRSRRKCSFPLRKISPYLVPFDESNVNSEQHADLPEHLPSYQAHGGVRKDSSSTQSSRKASVVSKISTYLVPFDASILTSEDPDEGHASGIVIELANDQEPSDFSDKVGELKEWPSEDDKAQESYPTAVHSTFTSTTPGETRKSSFPQKIVDACHVVETGVEQIQKTRRSWLKSPGLYKVCAVFAITQLVVGAGASYMPFYLTDFLLLPKESIAYFPLIVLVSGLFGTACSKLLERKLGNKWTYCLAAAVLIGTAVWFYFITKSVAYLTYPAAVMVGVTTSVMVAMSLTFLTELIGENKGTSGFVCSVAGFMAKLTGGVFYVTVQNFYPSPSTDEGDCDECASFARYVYVLTLGVPTVLTLLVVLFFQKANSPDGKRRETENQAPSVVVVNPGACYDSDKDGPVALTSYKSFVKPG